MESYKKLEALFEKVYRFQHLQNLAHWDARVIMPQKGVASRGEALAVLEEHINEMLDQKEVTHLMEEAKSNSSALNEVQKANLREMDAIIKNITAVPKELSAEKARLTTAADEVWQKARAANDFAAFLPTLKKIIALQRKEAEYRMKATNSSSLYEALFHMYEPGMPLEKVESIFSGVKTWLPGLIKQILEKQKGQVFKGPQPPFSKEKQEQLSKALMQIWGFDFEGGRLDVSTHPFTGMTKEDTRITTRFSDDIFANIYATIHETGHAKYEQNCGPRDMITQPVCTARSLGIHESQSLFAERMIARDRKFSPYLLSFVTRYLGNQEAFELNNFEAFTHRIQPGYIRTEADEVCYTMHIILRFEIEKALIEGTMQAEDVPRVWNEKMKEYLGLETLGKDNLGCLQDIHWSMGGFGYFPTYALGAMFAAQLMHTIRKELGSAEVDKAIEKGDLACLLAKQKEKIWDNGCIYETEELMVKATGEPLNPKYFQEHLVNRYLPGAAPML
eukprot:gene8416-5896_t